MVDTGRPRSFVVTLEEIVAVKGATTPSPIVLLQPGSSHALPTLTSVSFSLTGAQPTFLSGPMHEAVIVDAAPC